MVQVGFGLKGDLWAIAEALPDGANCIAVVNTVLEMKHLQQHLQRSGLISQVPHISFVQELRCPGSTQQHHMPCNALLRKVSCGSRGLAAWRCACIMQ